MFELLADVDFPVKMEEEEAEKEEEAQPVVRKQEKQKEEAQPVVKKQKKQKKKPLRLSAHLLGATLLPHRSARLTIDD